MGSKYPSSQPTDFASPSGPSATAGPDGRARGAPDASRGAGGRQAGRAVGRVAADLLAARVWLLALGHLVVFLLVYWSAFQLRFDFAVPPGSMDVFWLSAPWILVVKLLVFYFSGHYHGWWRYVTFADLLALLRAAGLSLLIIAAIDYFIFPYHVPRSVLILDCMIGILLLGALRASWRLFQEQFRAVLNHHDCRSALLVGADHCSGVLAQQIHAHPHLAYRIRGFLAADGQADPKRGSRMGHIPVLGKVEEVSQIASGCGATDVLVSAGTIPGTRMRRLMEACDRSGLNLKIIPPVGDLFDGDHHIPVRDIEISDLLHRDPVELDLQAIGTMLEGRSVMVTGAGGSIGSEICRQVIRFKPRALVLVGRGENRIFLIERELQDLPESVPLHACIADVADRVRMRQLFAAYRPDVVFHAAAHKHVPLMESNVGEAVKNNIVATRRLADLADEFGVGSFVFISTDKAVRPASVMGVTKQIAERYVQALSQDSSTRFTIVRFGNVLGSAGSVVPIFQKQIRRGGPITVTDARIERFFMTIPEASQLVLQAAAMGRGGEVFVLEMGQPVRIVDLARDLIRLSGLPENAIELTFTGVRPGEKLFEELCCDDEQTLTTTHPKVRAAYHPPYSLPDVRRAVTALARLAHHPGPDQQQEQETLRRLLHDLVPEYNGSPDAKHPEPQPPTPQPDYADQPLP